MYSLVQALTNVQLVRWMQHPTEFPGLGMLLTW